MPAGIFPRFSGHRIRQFDAHTTPASDSLDSNVIACSFQLTNDCICL